MKREKECPNCQSQCDRDEVDVGIGTIYGPWGCYSCGWSESVEYDLSKGQSPIKDGGVIDPLGRWRRIKKD